MQQHRISLTEEHYHMARRFMVVNRLPSARIAVQKMIEIVADRREKKDEAVTIGEGVSLPEEDEEEHRNGSL